MLCIEKRNIVDQLSEFIWDFKIGHNIIFNLRILYLMYDIRGNKVNHLFNKPIIVILVSVLEVVLIDFLKHLDEGVNDLPSSIKNRIESIKKKINLEKIFISRDEFLDYDVFKIKNYNYNDMIKIYEDFELLGSKNSQVYTMLKNLGYLRNRIHINNYHNNFEKNEYYVFTDKRVMKTEKILLNILEYMTINYPRNLSNNIKKAHADEWLKFLNKK